MQRGALGKPGFGIRPISRDLLPPQIAAATNEGKDAEVRDES